MSSMTRYAANLRPDLETNSPRSICAAGGEKQLDLFAVDGLPKDGLADNKFAGAYFGKGLFTTVSF